MIGAVETIAQATGYFQNNIRKNEEQGRVAAEVQEAIFQEKLKEIQESIQPVYNTRGKIVEDSMQSGSHIDIVVQHYCNLPPKRVDTSA